MKHIKRTVAIFFVLIMVVSMSATVFAANTTNTEFTNFFVEDWDENRLTPREKMDSSSHYFTYTTGAPVTVRVVSYGTTTHTTTGGANVTYSNGQTVSYVACRRGTQYNVHNLVNERGYTWASLGLMTLYTSMGDISGMWSPDSVGTYISARP